MQPSDLEWYSTDALIQELLSRTTFLGVIVHAEEDFKGLPPYGQSMFRVRFNDNLKLEQAGRLLDAIVDHIERRSL